MPASAYVEKAVLEWGLAGVAMPTAPVDMYLALFEEEQVRTATSNTGLKNELSYEGYLRVKITPEAAAWTFTAGTEAAVTKAVNKAAINFAKNTSTTGRAKAKNYALFGGAAGEGASAATAGKMYFYGPLQELLEIVKALNKVEFAAGALEINAE